MDIIDLYRKEYIEKQFERMDLFLQVKEKFSVENALYPGSYVHITPSFVFPHVVYVDSDKNAKKFFSDPEPIDQYIEEKKTYKAKTTFRFIHGDYLKSLDLPENSFDLLISQWAGPISQSCKRYLKPGGILLVNNSHADAGIAHLDSDYELIASVRSNQGKYNISGLKLEEYFIPKKDKNVTIESLLRSGKGIAYTKSANSYLFKRTN